MDTAQQGLPVVIHLASIASYDDMSNEPIQLMTTGRFFPGEVFSILRYQESQQDEDTGETIQADIQLVLKKHQVTMNRTGDFSTTMLFQRNKRFETRYQTPYGEMDMAVYTRNVRWDEMPEGGKVHLRYELNMQGHYASTNEMNLEYWKQ